MISKFRFTLCICCYSAVLELIAEETVTYSNIGAAANPTIHALRLGEAVLLVPAATEAAPGEEESQAVPASLVSMLLFHSFQSLILDCSTPARNVLDYLGTFLFFERLLFTEFRRSKAPF